MSCTEPSYRYRTARLIQGIDLEHSPKKAEEEVPEIPRGEREGRYQTARPGSYAYIPNWEPQLSADGLQVSFYVQPWLLNCPHTQTLVSTLDLGANTGFSIDLNKEGSLDVRVGTERNVEFIRTGLRPQEKVWSKIKLQITGSSTQVRLTHKPFRNEPIPPPAAFEGKSGEKASVFTSGSLLIAACQSPPAGNSSRALKPHATDFFNGRIDRLTIKACGQKPSILVKYDFSLDMASDRIVDVSGRGLNGVLVNAPTRAVKGYDWDGSVADWTQAKFGYGAIHFHDDDLDDAGWETDFTITIPASARSGAYAVEVEALNGHDTDSITFFVRPTTWTTDNSNKVCFVFSTFTYLAYANERMYDTTRPNGAEMGPSFDITKALKSAEFYKMRRRRDLGLSCYDRHIDGSGVCYSSSKRPILNVRPGYIMWGFSRPREFSADLFMINFLEQEGVPYEVLTDHDLHARGASALEGFNTVITGSHPEYPTYESFNAYNNFARRGGNLMYLGGNGFYWVSAVDAEGGHPHRLEVRRGDVGVRSFGLPGGEHVLSTNGGRGGLWRSRGMGCNTLFGIGFCGQGTSPGVPFRRTEAAMDAKFSWMFDGVDGDLLGECGFGGGASGDEIDRFDIENGSPNDALTLATSTGHDDGYAIAVEDLTYPALETLGTQTNRVRSDIVYYVGAGGGGVFSVGSINWNCSLAWDNYNNNIARLTINVIRGFLEGKQ